MFGNAVIEQPSETGAHRDNGHGANTRSVIDESFLSILSGLRGFVAAFEPERYAGESVAVMLRRFAEAEKLCKNAKLLMARRADEIASQNTEKETDGPQFVANASGEPVGRSRRDLQTARKLQDQPELEAALRSGELSADQAAVIAPAIEANPSAGPMLIETGRKNSFRELKGACDAVISAALSETERIDREARLRERRHLVIGTTEHGSLYLRGELPPVDGALVKNTLERLSRQVFDEARREGRRERHDAYMADALVRLCRENDPLRGSADPARAAREDDERRRVPRAEIVLHVDVEALRRGDLLDGETCDIEGVGPVPIATVEELFGNAWAKLVITKGKDIASITHLGRLIPAHLDSALRARDRVCQVPGCGITYGLERDHIIPVEENGPTELDNLVRLCKRHHYLKTHKFWRLTGGPGTWKWQNIRLEQPIVPEDESLGVAPPGKPSVGLAAQVLPREILENQERMFAHEDECGPRSLCDAEAGGSAGGSAAAGEAGAETGGETASGTATDSAPPGSAGPPPGYPPPGYPPPGGPPPGGPEARDREARDPEARDRESGGPPPADSAEDSPAGPGAGQRPGDPSAGPPAAPTVYEQQLFAS
jgi:hypothetical protein